MLNRYKKEELSEEQQEKMRDALEEKADVSRNFFHDLLKGNAFSSSRAVSAIPFICFLAILAIVYIANRHFAENSARKIDKLAREVKSLSWEYKTSKAELMRRSTQSQVALKVDSMGLKGLIAPPQKITVGNKE